MAHSPVPRPTRRRRRDPPGWLDAAGHGAPTDAGIAESGADGLDEPDAARRRATAADRPGRRRRPRPRPRRGASDFGYGDAEPARRRRSTAPRTTARRRGRDVDELAPTPATRPSARRSTPSPTWTGAAVRPDDPTRTTTRRPRRPGRRPRGDPRVRPLAATPVSRDCRSRGACQLGEHALARAHRHPGGHDHLVRGHRVLRAALPAGQRLAWRPRSARPRPASGGELQPQVGARRRRRR